MGIAKGAHGLIISAAAKSCTRGIKIYGIASTNPSSSEVEGATSGPI